jgi:hypothetical protein
MAEIKITDVLGKEVKSILINDKNTSGDQINSIRIDGSDLKSGIYLYSLLVDGKIIRTNKLVVM